MIRAEADKGIPNGFSFHPPPLHGLHFVGEEHGLRLCLLNSDPLSAEYSRF